MGRPGAGGRVVLGFDSAVIRSGGERAAGCAEAAAAVLGRLAGLVFDPAPFGEVDQAQPLATALVAVRDGFGGMAESVRAYHVDLTDRAGSTAGSGDHLVAVTSQLAAAAAPATVGRGTEA